MSPGKAKNYTRPVISNAKEKKRSVKRVKKMQKCLKTICDPLSNEIILSDQILSSAKQNTHILPPFVRLKRLDFGITDPNSLYKLSIPVTENGEIIKSSQKKTKIKEKNKILESASSSVKNSSEVLNQICASTSAILSSSKNDIKLLKEKKLYHSNSDTALPFSRNTIPHIVKELNDTSSNQICIKNDGLCNSIYNHASLDNDDCLCKINSSSSLMCDINDIISLKTKKYICNCDTCVPAILDASVIADAFKFYKCHKKISNLSSSTNDFSINQLSHSNYLSSEADNSCNELMEADDSFPITEGEVPQSLAAVTSNSELRAVMEHITATSDCVESRSIREISDYTHYAGSNAILENPGFNRIYMQSIQEEKQEKVEVLSTVKDIDFSNDEINNFQTNNDLDIKICNVRSYSSEQVIQCVMGGNELINEMSINNETDKFSFFSNYEQDSAIECEDSAVERRQPAEKSSVTIEKADVVSVSGLIQINSNQPSNILNCDISKSNSLTINEEKSTTSLMENSDILDKDVQSPNKRSCTITALNSLCITSDHRIQSNSKDQTIKNIASKHKNEKNELSQNDVENSTNVGSEFEWVSSAKHDEQNSNSRGFHKTDILFDELDYEPSEVGEFEVSESESNNGEMDTNENHLDIRISATAKQTINEVNKIQLNNDDSIFRHSFAEEPEKDSLMIRSDDEEDNQLFNKTKISFNNDSVESIQQNDTLQEKNAENSNTEFDAINDHNVQEINLNRSINSEDDSESDSEHSFKRKNSNSNQGINSVVEENSVDKFSQVKVDSSIKTLEEVLLSIEEKCKNGKIDDALQIANNYIPISNYSVQKNIFIELFINIIESFRDSDPPLMEDFCLDIMKDTMGIFYELNLYETELCSDIIIECLSMNLTFPFGQQLFAICQKNNIIIDATAVMLYINFIKPSEMSLIETISFLNFIWKCKVSPPKTILKEMWNLLFQDKEDTSPSVITEICTLLCNVDSSEVDKEDLKNFLKLCIEKKFWSQIVHLISAWAKKGSLIACLIETFTPQLEDIGFYFEELAKEIYDQNDNCNRFKCAISLDKWDCAYSWKLHPRNIMTVLLKSLAFTALDICLYLERPKDAYMIFKSLSLTLPNEFEESLKFEICRQRFHYLLKITLALQSKDPLVRGISALRSLLSMAQKDFILEQLNDCSKDIQAIYNKYMVCILNTQDENLIKEFYSYTCGPQKELFTLDCQVLRGLTVFFVKHGMLEEANKLFLWGYSKDVYEFEKPTVMIPPWQMMVNCNWTSEEIKLTFLRFADTLTPYLRSKKKIDDFDKWFSVEILIKNVTKVDYEVDCLNEYSENPIQKRICNALKSVDSNIRWKSGRGGMSVVLNPETFYSFWFSKFSSSSESTEIFKVPGKMRISFGVSCAQESFDNESPMNFSDLESSEALSNCYTTETHSVDTRVHEEKFLSDDFVNLSTKNILEVPKNIFLNSCSNDNELCIQENVSKNIDYFSPKKTTSNTSSTPPNIEEHIPSAISPHLSPPKTALTTSSPQKSFLKSSDKIVSPGVQKNSSQVFSPKSNGSPGGMTVSNTNFENADQNSSFRKNINFDCRISPQQNTVTNNLPESSNSDNLILPAVSANESVETLDPKIRSSSTLIKKGISTSCSSYKKATRTLIKAKSKIKKRPLNFENINITLQNTSVQGDAHRIVKPMPGVKLHIGASQRETIDSGESNFKCMEQTQGDAHQIVKPMPGVKLHIGASQRETIDSEESNFQCKHTQGHAHQIVKPMQGVKLHIGASQRKTIDSEKSNFQCNIPKDVFQKITNFLKSKVMVKRKDLTPQQQQKKALSLAEGFIQKNVVNTLDKRTMKLLNDYSDECL
ncbi:hypothetical protein HNY73_017041 [Argiope bruennichi]|uniref:Uncharacterized protein n=1 Tax=Argiope bruennichi TaxID=94029 RepID=A0A8T0ELN5_ARGBR|nr:hypothetical protein HNY73_017041 [Argiope bruennichi]